MPVELKVPEVGESITEVQIAQWRKRVGESAQKDENLVEIESDKATVELPSPIAGTITQILKQPGEKAKVGEVIGYIDGKVAAGESKPAAGSTPTSGSSPAKPQAGDARVMPAAERVLAQENLRVSDVTPTGPGGRVLKEDAQRAAQEKSRAAAPTTSASATKTAPPPLRADLLPAEVARPTAQLPASLDTGYPRDEEHVVMSPIRARIAQRLVEAQQTAALLTTFNEVDMGEVMDLRGKFKDAFEKKHGVKLGFMSFFVKAVIDALRQFPQLNAEVREPHIVYRSYYDIGIAVGGGKGLVVPVLRNAEFMSFAEIEQKIADYGRRAQENKLKLDELQGGTFTISNGGVYGSLLSTPIINPPQSGILGLHAIQDRPVAKSGQVVIRPMMYLALTYDHRIVDGREAVQFLKRIKDVLEDPSRMLIEI